MQNLLLPKANPFRRNSAQKTGWIGVDIGAGAIKIAQVEREANQFRIARSVILRAPDGTTFDEGSLEDGSVAEEIRNVIHGHGGFRGSSAACVLSMSHCDLRTLSSVTGNEDEQRELISLELKRDSSLRFNTQEFDFWDGATEQQRDSKGMTQVHVLSMPRSLADHLGTALLDASLKCRVLDTVPFCALRAMEMDAAYHTSDAMSSPTRVMLDWGFSTATLVAFREGIPILARCLRNCGLSVLTKRLAERLKLTRVQAEVLLMEIGIHGRRRSDSNISGLRDLIVELASPLLHELTEELMQTLDFLRMHGARPESTELILCGGGGCIPGISRQLTTTSRVSVRPWKLPNRSADLVHPEPILANAAALSALAWEQ